MGCALGEVRDVKEYVAELEVSPTKKHFNWGTQSINHFKMRQYFDKAKVYDLIRLTVRGIRCVVEKEAQGLRSEIHVELSV